MKRFIIYFGILMMCFALTGCGNNKDEKLAVAKEVYEKCDGTIKVVLHMGTLGNSVDLTCEEIKPEFFDY